MAGGEPRLGTTATYMRHNDHGTTRLSTKIDILHDRSNNEYRVFSAGSVRKWSKFGLVVGHRGYGRRWTAARFAQQQQEGYGSERDQHQQLEIIDIGNHRGLPRHLGVERCHP